MIGLVLAAALATGAVDADQRVLVPSDLIVRPIITPMPALEKEPRFYPEEARRYGLTGHAGIYCKVTEQGELSACQVFREDPQGFGFAKMLLHLSALFRVGPVDRDGQATAGHTVKFEMTFKPPAY